MGDKRYTTARARALLARLVAHTVAPVRPERARRDLRDLLAARLGDVVVADAAAEQVGSASDSQVAAWNAKVGRLIATGAQLRSFRIGQAIRVAAHLTVSASATRIDATGEAGAMLAIQTHLLLRCVGDVLRVCPCGRVFVREGKRQYCSDRCQKRYYMREKRARERAEEDVYGTTTRTR